MNISKIPVFVTLVGLLSLSGCFNEEKQMTAFLEPDGTVTFLIYVHNVYSTEKKIDRRVKEESDLRDRLLNERDVPLMEALIEAGAKRVHVDVIRDRVPYEYIVKSEFDSFEDFFEALLSDNEMLNVNVETQLDGNARSIVITHEDSGPAKEGVKDSPVDSDILLLVVNGENLKAIGLRHIGKNGVILNPSFVASASLTWNMRPKPSPESSDTDL